MGYVFFSQGGGVLVLQQFLAVTAGMSRCTRQRCSSIPFVGHRYCHCEWHAGALELFPRTSALLFFCAKKKSVEPVKNGGGGVHSSGREGRTSLNLCYVFFGGLTQK